MSGTPKVPTDEELRTIATIGWEEAGWDWELLVAVMAKELLERRQEVVKLKRALQWFFDNDPRFSLLTSKPEWLTEDEIRRLEPVPGNRLDSAPAPAATEQPLGLLDESPNETPPGELPSEDVSGRS